MGGSRSKHVLYSNFFLAVSGCGEILSKIGQSKGHLILKSIFFKKRMKKVDLRFHSSKVEIDGLFFE